MTHFSPKAPIVDSRLNDCYRPEADIIGLIQSGLRVWRTLRGTTGLWPQIRHVVDLSLKGLVAGLNSLRPIRLVSDASVQTIDGCKGCWC